MKRKKIVSMVAAMSLVAVVGIGGTLAYFTDTDEVSNVVTMGQVSGTLTEENGTNFDGMEFTNVMPGDVFAKDPKVALDADSQPAYVRVKLEYAPGEGFDANLTDLGLNVDQTKWSYSEGYYYYMVNDGIMNPGSDEYLFTQVTIPKEWNNSVVGKGFTLNLRAEFIQADNIDGSVIQRDSFGNIIGWNLTDDQIQANNN